MVVQAVLDACAEAGQGAPSPAVTASALRQGSSRIAATIARHWELSPRLCAALDAQLSADPHAMDALARALALSGPAAVTGMREACSPA